MVVQETKRVTEFTATPPLESLTFMFSRCMTGASRQLAKVRALGFYDINGAHFLSKARRTIVIKVPHEDSERKTGYAVLDKGHVRNEGFGTRLRCGVWRRHGRDGLLDKSLCTLSVPFDQNWRFCVQTRRDFVVLSTSSNKISSNNKCPHTALPNILPLWDHVQHLEMSNKSEC